MAALLAGPEHYDPVRAAIEAELGAVDFASSPIPFTFTRYYEAEMGERLLRAFFTVADLVDPATLADIKVATHGIERRFAPDGRRRANLDPGLVSGSRFVLASTKDSSHRVPLGRGIYAEVTLVYEHGRFRPVEWTYPDYASSGYREILQHIRARYLEELRHASDGDSS